MASYTCPCCGQTKTYTSDKELKIMLGIGSILILLLGICLIVLSVYYKIDTPDGMMFYTGTLCMVGWLVPGMSCLL